MPQCHQTHSANDPLRGDVDVDFEIDLFSIEIEHIVVKNGSDTRNEKYKRVESASWDTNGWKSRDYEQFTKTILYEEVAGTQNLYLFEQ